ncbi:hypothetical protein BDV97DRAFT_401335 [Delphinella strobiligena]|nr:hypothetical protein BDV97DRAFT_401335 [Delphinella strobiligena]
MLETQAVTALARTVEQKEGDGGFAQHISALIKFGDTEQQDGFVLSRDGQYNTANEFLEQRRISLFTRLIMAGFPVIMLDEQRRLHPMLMDMVNKFHYDFQVRSMEIWPLDPKYENLVADITGADPKHLTELGRRLAWLHTEHGKPLVNRNTEDSASLPQFFFGKKTSEYCGIGVAYSEMKSDIMTPCHDKRKDEGWTEQELPEIQCFDSLRGKEKKVFCLVLVNNGKNEGFLKDKKRACVMFTRAIDVQIVVGGGFFGT